MRKCHHLPAKPIFQLIYDSICPHWSLKPSQWPSIYCKNWHAHVILNPRLQALTWILQDLRPTRCRPLCGVCSQASVGVPCTQHSAAQPSRPGVPDTGRSRAWRRGLPGSLLTMLPCGAAQLEHKSSVCPVTASRVDISSTASDDFYTPYTKNLEPEMSGSQCREL